MKRISEFQLPSNVLVCQLHCRTMLYKSNIHLLSLSNSQISQAVAALTMRFHQYCSTEKKLATQTSNHLSASGPQNLENFFNKRTLDSYSQLWGVFYSSYIPRLATFHPPQSARVAFYPFICLKGGVNKSTVHFILSRYPSTSLLLDPSVSISTEKPKAMLAKSVVQDSEYQVEWLWYVFSFHSLPVFQWGQATATSKASMLPMIR